MLERLGEWILYNFGVIAAAALLVLTFSAGWYVNGSRWEARHANLKAEHAEEMSARDRAVLEAIEQVRELERQGDEIAARLIAADAARTKLAKERDNAIRQMSANRPCLDAGLVRLLNEPVGSGVDLRLPSASGNSSVPDSAFTTDTDIGLWAAHARDAHDACRARIDAIRTFHEQEITP